MRKKIITIIAFILGVIICSGTTGVVAYSFASNQIGYIPTDSNWEVTTVADAINDLYLKKVGDNYSTDEKVVGTWVNGKPLYQKTFYKKSVSTSPASISVLSLNVDTFVNMTGFADLIQVTQTQGDLNVGVIPIPSYNVGAYNFDISIKSTVARDGIAIYYDTFDSRNYRFDNIYITLQYTKTTDTIPNNNQG